MSSSSSASPNQDENFAAAASAPEISRGPGGMSARMRTSGVSVSASRGKSRWASAATSPSPGSVAEDRCVVIADPLPEGSCAADPSVCDQLALVQLAGVEADRTDEELSAALGELCEEPRDRRAAVAGDRLGVSGKGKANGLLGQEHRHLLAALERCTSDEERDGHPLAVVESGREIDHNLRWIRHGEDRRTCAVSPLRGNEPIYGPRPEWPDPAMPSPYRPAREAAAVLEVSPSLRRMFATWRFTVCSLRTRRSAMSRFVRPTATRSSTSNSRRPSPPSGVSATSAGSVTLALRSFPSIVSARVRSASAPISRNSAIAVSISR